MTYNNLIKNIDKLDDKVRVNILEKVIKNFSVLSLNDLKSFTEDWNPTGKVFDDFKKAQNELIVNLIKLECSDLGKSVRKQFNLKEIKLNDEIK